VIPLLFRGDYRETLERGARGLGIADDKLFRARTELAERYFEHSLSPGTLALLEAGGHEPGEDLFD